MVHFSNFFFLKNSKNLCHFSKNSKKFRKKFTNLQINELSEDVSLSNGVLILIKAVSIINSFYVTNFDRFCQQLNIKNQILNSLMVFKFFHTILISQFSSKAILVSTSVQLTLKMFQFLSWNFSRAIFRKIRKTKSIEKFDFFFEKNQVYKAPAL
jgi:hypothetical protein